MAHVLLTREEAKKAVDLRVSFFNSFTRCAPSARKLRNYKTYKARSECPQIFSEIIRGMLTYILKFLIQTFLSTIAGFFYHFLVN